MTRVDSWGLPDCPNPLCRTQAAVLDRLTADVDTYALKAAQMRIVELEQIVQRLNKKIARGNQ